MQTIVQRNNVSVVGQGPTTMILANGFGCNQAMWRLFAPEFQDAYRIVQFDYVGSGDSDRNAYSAERYGSLEGYAQDLLEVCAEVNVRDAVFVGHSVSSMIGVLASLKEPGLFDRLVMIGPSPCYINDPTQNYVGGFEREDILGLLDMMDKNFMGWAGFFAPMVMQNPDHPEHAQALEASICSTDPVTARQFAEVTFLSDTRRELGQVTTPSLILQCSDDAVAPLEVGTHVSRQLKNSTLAVIEATGHCPHVSHPQETVRLVREYLTN